MANRMYIILPMQGGIPVIGNLTYTGHVLIEKFKTSGLYMVTGKESELDALSALSGAVLISKITDDEKDNWKELKDKPDKTAKDKINEMVNAEVTSKPVITDKDSFREIILKLVKNKDFEKTEWVKYE